MSVITSVRLRFGSLFRPRAFDSSQSEKFEATLIIDEGSAADKAVKKAMSDVAKDKWGDKAAAVFKELKAGDKLCLRDGNIRSGKYPEFTDKLFVTAKSDVMPYLVDQFNEAVEADNGIFQDGAIVNADISLWAQDNQQWGKRINANLLGIQFVSCDDPLGQARRSEPDTFQPLDIDEDESEGDDDILA